MNCIPLLEFCKNKFDFDDSRVDYLLNCIEILDFISISFSDYFTELVRSNVITNNLTTLINRVNILFTQIYDKKRSVPSSKINVGLHIITYYMKYLSKFSNEEKRKQFLLSSTWPITGISNHVLPSNIVFESFISNLINFFEIYDSQSLNLKQVFYYSMRCLISLINKDPGDNSNNLVMEYIQNLCIESTKINQFNNSLAALMIKRTIATSYQDIYIPQSIHYPTKHESIITKVFAFLLNSWNFNVFSGISDSVIVLPASNIEFNASKNLSLIVLLLLLYDKNSPVKHSFISVKDSSLESRIFSEELDVEKGYAYTININFHEILYKLSDDYSEPSILFLYSFLNLHPNANEYLIASKSIVPIFTNLLKGIYQSNKYPNATMESNYILIICLIQLTQDSATLEILSKSYSDTTWIKERKLFLSTNCLSLNLCLSSILEMVNSTIYSSRDLFILSHCFAILLNISSKCNSIDTHTSEKLILLIGKICKKIKGGVYNNSEDVKNFQASWFVLYKFITISLLNTIKSNECISLLYTMLQFYSQIELIFTDPHLLKILEEPHIIITEPQFEPFITNCYAYFNPSEILSLLKKYLSFIETKFAHKSFTASHAITEIKKELANETNITSKLNELDSSFTYYQYQEENDNELFFRAYIWKMANNVFL